MVGEGISKSQLFFRKAQKIFFLCDMSSVSGAMGSRVTWGVGVGIPERTILVEKKPNK